jgi:hypothetical protein
MTKHISTILCAALFMGAACFFAPTVQAGSCCGGGAGTTLILPKGADSMVNLTLDMEKYDGFWTNDGKYFHDQPGTDLRQYRMNTGYALRLAPRWQASVALPYVWNENKYSGLTSRTQGLGDTTFNLWYEAFDSVMCRWKYFDIEDLKPAASFGLSLTVPTGVSPYDNVSSSFDITGRGFYRLDGNVLFEKTLFPWTASLFMSYGKYIERPVDREYGVYVEPYRKRLGDRTVGTLMVSYVDYLDIRESRSTMIYAGTISEIWEGRSTINGEPDPTSGFKKTSVAGSIAYGTLDRAWIVQLSWNHSIMKDGWGYNFPASDIYSVGVTHVFK